MVEGSMEMAEYSAELPRKDADVATTSYINNPASESTYMDIPDSEHTHIRKQEAAHDHCTGSSLEALRRDLVKTQVNAFLKAVAKRYGLLPGQFIYDEFVLAKNGRDLFLKEGLVQVTYVNDSTKYKVLKSIGKAAWIREHLFPGYTTTTPVAPPRNKKMQAGLAVVKNQLPAAAETVEPADLSQCANNFDTAVKKN